MVATHDRTVGARLRSDKGIAPTRSPGRGSPRPGDRALIDVPVTYPSREVRDAALGSGMVAGMETSYARRSGRCSARAWPPRRGNDGSG